MAIFKKISLLALSIAFISSSLIGQESNYSDADMEKFAMAFEQVQSVNQQIQNEMVGAIQEEGLDVQEFNQIQQATQAEGEDTEIFEEDMAKFQKSMAAIQKVQTEAQEKMKKVIEESGLELQKYQEIMRAVQEDPAMQAKLQKMMGSKGQ
jgi:hypothetical protein